MSARQMTRDASMRLQPLPRVSAAPWPLRPLIRAWRAVQALFVRWTIWETESYLRDCAKDGLMDGVSLRYFQADLQAMRVRLIDLTTRD